MLRGPALLVDWGRALGWSNADIATRFSTVVVTCGIGRVAGPKELAFDEFPDLFAWTTLKLCRLWCGVFGILILHPHGLSSFSIMSLYIFSPYSWPVWSFPLTSLRHRPWFVVRPRRWPAGDPAAWAASDTARIGGLGGSRGQKPAAWCQGPAP